jgi:nitronate monooxygenase
MNPISRFLEIFGVKLPIVQAPMAGSSDAELAVAVSEAGGLGSLPCAMLTPDKVVSEVDAIRRRTSRPLNLNFFCHEPAPADPSRENKWKERLNHYYGEFGIDTSSTTAGPNRTPFDDSMCDAVVGLKPEVVSFHFGLPSNALLDRVRATGTKILSSATTVEESRWLEARGCDAIIAQGFEAGGHRGMFLTSDPATQVGTFALVPQIVDAIRIPVIASGGIADARGIAAALALGASAVQIGTAYLLCPESRASAIHRKALETARDSDTVITNVITGRPARGIVNRMIRDNGPIDSATPVFPRAAEPLAALRSHAEKSGSGDFSPLWAGQAVGMCRAIPAGILTKELARRSIEILKELAELTG